MEHGITKESVCVDVCARVCVCVRERERANLNGLKGGLPKGHKN